MNVLKRMSCESRCTKPARFENWPKEGLPLFAQLNNLFEEQEKKNTALKTKKDVGLLERFFEKEGRGQEK